MVSSRSNESFGQYQGVKNSNFILTALQNSISRLLEDEDISIDVLLNQLLKEAGHSLHTSRAFVFSANKQASGDYLLSQTHEWTAEGIEPHLNNPVTRHVNLAELGLSHWQSQFLNQELIHLSSSALNSAEKLLFRKLRIVEIVMLPIFINAEWRGFIGFDESASLRGWLDVEKSALMLLAKIIGSAMGFIELKQAKQLAEKQASDVQQKIYEALESAEHGVWDWDVRTNKVFYSKALQKQLGYDEYTFNDDMSEWSSRVHPDDIAMTQQLVRDHIDGKSPIYRAEFRMQKKDGSYAWILAIGKVIRDEHGEAIRLFGTHTDLSFQKDLEEQLFEQQQLLESLVQGFPDLVWLKDKDGVYLAANSRFEEFLGQPAHKIIGKTDYDYVDKDLADFFRAHDISAMKNGYLTMNEETITFASDGHQETLETIKTPIHHKNGELIGVLGVGRDITERKCAEEQAKLAASVFKNAHEGIMICDANVEVIDVNPEFERLSGYSKRHILGENPRVLSAGITEPKYYQALWQQIKEHGYWQGELVNRKKSGQVYPVLSNISVIKDENQEITHYVSIFTDITHLKVNQKKLEHMAHYDALTGLPNRVLLAERLEKAIQRCTQDDLTLAVCFIDLDNFKPINDLLGHAAGDRLLKILSERLTKNLRTDDTLARIGGDEFILLLNQKNKEEINLITQKVLEIIEQPLKIDSHQFTLSASMGVALFPDEQSDADTLLRHADQAMYEAKLKGKNRAQYFDIDAAKAYKQSTEQQIVLTRALEQDQFILYFQPKVNLKTNQIIGFEALIRWHHPEKGLLLPNEFLPAIEQLKLSFELDLWVLKQSLKQLLIWFQNGVPYVLSINVSPGSLLTERYVNALEHAFEDYSQLTPSHLELEVLESTNFSEIEIARQHLHRIKQIGIRVALDDFGTGASSLSYLKNLPADAVKIDKSFIFDILEDRNDLAIVEGIIQLARVFELDVIAEGVESEKHAGLLVAMGCYLVQGYWISRPIAPEILADFIRNWEHKNAIKCEEGINHG